MLGEDLSLVHDEQHATRILHSRRGLVRSRDMGDTRPRAPDAAGGRTRGPRVRHRGGRPVGNQGGRSGGNRAGRSGGIRPRVSTGRAPRPGALAAPVSGAEVPSPNTGFRQERRAALQTEHKLYVGTNGANRSTRAPTGPAPRRDPDHDSTTAGYPFAQRQRSPHSLHGIDSALSIGDDTGRRGAYPGGNRGLRRAWLRSCRRSRNGRRSRTRLPMVSRTCVTAAPPRHPRVPGTQPGHPRPVPRPLPDPWTTDRGGRGELAGQHGADRVPGPGVCVGSGVVRPKGGPGGVWCVLSVCRAEVLVLDVLGLSPGAASGGAPCSESLGERARRRPAGATSDTGPSRCPGLVRLPRLPGDPAAADRPHRRGRGARRGRR